MRIRNKKQRIITTKASISAYMDIVNVAKEFFKANIKRVNGGLVYLIRVIRIRNTEVYLLMSIVDSDYGIRLESKSYFWFNESRMMAVDDIMKELSDQVQIYWNEGKGKLTEESNRPVMEAELRQDGWVECPFCKINFATYGARSWQDNTHLGCGTKIKLVLKQFS